MLFIICYETRQKKSLTMLRRSSPSFAVLPRLTSVILQIINSVGVNIRVTPDGIEQRKRPPSGGSV